jgi:hypothetical protein
VGTNLSDKIRALNPEQPDAAGRIRTRLRIARSEESSHAEVMSPWLETIGVCGLAILGAWLGWRSSRLPKPYWMVGYFVPLGLIVAIGAARRFTGLESNPPFSWIMSGRTPFALTALITTMILTTPLSRLSPKRVQRWVILLMVCIVSYASIWPFIAPAFNRKFWKSVETQIDKDGICRQSSGYSCGPASAVTALKRLGFHGEEGEIAILAHTSDAMGTPPGILCQTLQRRYGQEGLRCELRHFKSIEELKEAGLTIALIKFGLMVDHYVVVFEVTKDSIVVGDPFLGKNILTHEEFKKKWRFSGIVMKR